jgi:hypothetical protein
VNYRYEWVGQWYGADGVMPYKLHLNEKRDAEIFLAPYRPEVTTRVWVNPRDPGHAYLRVDWGHYPFGMLLFMTPFVLIALTIVGLWTSNLIFRIRRHGLSEQEVLRLEELVVDTPERVVFRVDFRFGWFLVPAAFGFVSFLSIFAFGLTIGHVNNVPLWVVFGVWSLGLVVGLLAQRIELARKPDHKIQFVIDRTSGMYRIGDRSGSTLEISDVVVHPVNDRNRETRFKLALRTIQGDLFAFGSSAREADSHRRSRDLLRSELGLSDHKADGPEL